MMRNAKWFSVVVACQVLISAAPAEVTFELAQDQLSSPAVSVAVVGSFNGWDASANPMALADGKWSVSVALPDGRHQYKFVWMDAADAEHWLNDPANPYLIYNGENGANNLVEVANGVRMQPTGEWERFEWEAPEAEWVNLAGDFNGWRMDQFTLAKQADGTWIACLPLRRPFAYKFIIDGRWRCDVEDRAPRIPNEVGTLNSFRPATDVTTPTAIVITREIAAGDATEIDRIATLAETADYGRAIALARKVAEVNTEQSGSTSALVLRALEAEAVIHKRWYRMPEAAACWERLAASDVDSSETFHALKELACYHLFTTGDLEKGRQYSEMAVERAPNNLALIRMLARTASSLYGERRFADAVSLIDRLVKVLPPPEGQDKQYACELSHLYLTKGLAHYFQQEWGQARKALETCIRVNPWDDSEHVQKARAWLRGVDRNEAKTVP